MYHNFRNNKPFKECVAILPICSVYLWKQSKCIGEIIKIKSMWELLQGKTVHPAGASRNTRWCFCRVQTVSVFLINLTRTWRALRPTLLHVLACAPCIGSRGLRWKLLRSTKRKSNEDPVLTDNKPHVI